jgi:hypothetical protein
MFEAVSVAFQGWREVLHISEWTGISIGALGLLAFGAYMLPETRALAIRTAIVVAVGYVGLLYGDHTGRADVTAQWDAANAKAKAAAAAEDASAQKDLDAKYLQQQNDALQQQVKDYESKMVGVAGGTCQLGAGPLRLRKPR